MEGVTLLKSRAKNEDVWIVVFKYHHLLKMAGSIALGESVDYWKDKFKNKIWLFLFFDGGNKDFLK